MVNFNHVLVSHAEIGLKSRRTRSRLENLLIRNLEYMLMRNKISEFTIGRADGKILISVKGNAEKVAEVVSRVFGVASCMPSIKTKASLPKIIEVGKRLAKEVLSIGETFAVRARRIGAHPFTSKEVEEKIGAEILKELSDRNVKVNLTNPNKIIYVEVRGDYAYVSDRVIKGPNGLPLESQGRVLMLFSGGLNSAIASWLLMKRGSLPILTYFDLYLESAEVFKEEAIRIARFLREFVSAPDYRLFIVPLRGISHEFLSNYPEGLAYALLHRMMYRIACELALQKEIKAIATGNSLEHIALQINLSILDEASSLPVFRPLIGMSRDKVEEMGRKVGISRYLTIPVSASSLRPSGEGISLNEVKEAEAKIDLEGLKREALHELEEIIL